MKNIIKRYMAITLAISTPATLMCGPKRKAESGNETAAKRPAIDPTDGNELNGEAAPEQKPLTTESELVEIAPASSLPGDALHDEPAEPIIDFELPQAPAPIINIDQDAIFNSDYDAVRAQLAQGRVPSPHSLWYAIYNHDLAMVKILVDAGASITEGLGGCRLRASLERNLDNEYSKYPTWSVDILRYLIAQGAPLSTPGERVLLDSAIDYGRATAIIELLYANAPAPHQTVIAPALEREIYDYTHNMHTMHQKYLTKILLALAYDVSLEHLKSALACVAPCYDLLEQNYATPLPAPDRFSKRTRKSIDKINEAVWNRVGNVIYTSLRARGADSTGAYMRASNLAQRGYQIITPEFSHGRITQSIKSKKPDIVTGKKLLYLIENDFTQRHAMLQGEHAELHGKLLEGARDIANLILENNPQTLLNLCVQGLHENRENPRLHAKYTYTGELPSTVNEVGCENGFISRVRKVKPNNCIVQ
jgi:hypothetical protein